MSSGTRLMSIEFQYLARTNITSVASIGSAPLRAARNDQGQYQNGVEDVNAYIAHTRILARRNSVAGHGTMRRCFGMKAWEIRTCQEWNLPIECHCRTKSVPNTLVPRAIKRR